MDFFAHALWTGAFTKITNKKVTPRLNVWLAVFWGVFPDVFAFTPLFIWIFGNLIFGSHVLPSFHPQEIEPPTGAVDGGALMQNFTHTLYSTSHSLVIFVAVFLLVWFLRWVLHRATGKISGWPMWEMSGWLLHILIDIPTHSTQFYATPFLWPISDIHVNGLPWSTPWFMIVNYAGIVMAYTALSRLKRT